MKRSLDIYVVDRIKDLMKTSNGKYVTPQPIENLLSNNTYIAQAMIVAEGKPFVTALIIPNYEAVKEQLTRMNLPFTSWQELVNSD